MLNCSFKLITFKLIARQEVHMAEHHTHTHTHTHSVNGAVTRWPLLNIICPMHGLTITERSEPDAQTSSIIYPTKLNFSSKFLHFCWGEIFCCSSFHPPTPVFVQPEQPVSCKVIKKWVGRVFNSCFLCSSGRVSQFLASAVINQLSAQSAWEDQCAALL